jgi:hypothetical protein
MVDSSGNGRTDGLLILATFCQPVDSLGRHHWPSHAPLPKIWSAPQLLTVLRT